MRSVFIKLVPITFLLIFYCAVVGKADAMLRSGEWIEDREAASISMRFERGSRDDQIAAVYMLAPQQHHEDREEYPGGLRYKPDCEFAVELPETVEINLIREGVQPSNESAASLPLSAEYQPLSRGPPEDDRH